MRLIDRLIAPFTTKGARRPRRLAGLADVGRPVWTPRDYGALAREGYAKNPVVFRSVNRIADAVASARLVVKDGARELTEHPLLDLLARPNPRQSGAAFLEAVTAHLLIAGNAYLEAAVADGRIVELHTLRPDRMRVVPGPDGWPVAYDHTVGTHTTRFRQDDGAPPPILHLTMFHPTNDHYGLAPLEAAAVSLDILNAAAAWHKALLDNSARPSGALVYAPASGATLSREQFERLKEELETTFQGAGNAGRPLLLEGGLDWKALSLSPRDLDFVEAKHAAAREVALAFGVPPMLLGIPGDNTYANYQEANRAFWRDTALPLATKLAGEIAHWLSPAVGAVDVSIDIDAVAALHAEREALWRRVTRADFLTDDEKREAVGYGRKET
jgi:HK97 family phage portal protein